MRSAKKLKELAKTLDISDLTALVAHVALLDSVKHFKTVLKDNSEFVDQETAKEALSDPSELAYYTKEFLAEVVLHEINNDTEMMLDTLAFDYVRVKRRKKKKKSSS